MTEHVDVLIIGAGLSGIGGAVHLGRECPDKSYMILENRDAIGGTWDLFRYPGIRSDSDMHTLGFNFKPWPEAKAIADGPNIKRYVSDVADEYGVTPHIRFNHKVISADWRASEGRWYVQAEHNGEPVEISCQFIYCGAGYYKYEEGYRPDFPGEDKFQGQIIHPQHWPEDLDYAGKKVAIIGSGATAVTLVPAMAEKAVHVTMVQRSPTWIVSRPSKDAVSNFLRSVLPKQWAYNVTRFKNTRLQQFMYNRTRTQPGKVRDHLIKLMKKDIPEDQIEAHFTPTYNPWDQRLCLVPDSDLFNALNDGSASVVTDHIDTFTETGIQMKGGEHVDADIIVTATGLQLQAIGGIQLSLDGEALQVPERVIYKGMMYSDVPNFASVFGYTNASWTLKADLIAQYVCRLLNHMDETGTSVATPTISDPDMKTEPFMQDFSSGYFARAQHLLPKQGSKHPWKLYQNYAADKKMMMGSDLDDGNMVFSNPVKEQEEVALEAAE